MKQAEQYMDGLSDGLHVSLEIDESTKSILRRLRNIEGQTRGLQRMAEEDKHAYPMQLLSLRGCPNSVPLRPDCSLPCLLAIWECCRGEAENAGSESPTKH